MPSVGRSRYLPGATVRMVVRRGRYSTATIAASAPMAHHSLSIFSMTKPIVSSASCSCRATVKLRARRSLSKFIPEVRQQPGRCGRDVQARPRPDQRRMTVQDLLRHTSGLTYDITGSGPVQRFIRRAGSLSRSITNAEHATVIADMPLICQPGAAEWNYSRSTDVARPRHRSRLGQIARRLPHRPHLRAAAAWPRPVSYPRKREPRVASPSRSRRSVERRQGELFSMLAETDRWNPWRRRASRPLTDYARFSQMLRTTARSMATASSAEVAGVDGLGSSRQVLRLIRR